MNVAPRADPAPGQLPDYVAGQRDFYLRGTATARLGYLITEALSISAAAAVPVTVAAGAPRWLIAALGALAAIATGLRQAFNFKENWIMRAVAGETIKGHIAHYLCGEPNQRREQVLIDRVRRISLAETTRWQQVLSQSATDQHANGQATGQDPTT
jgi:hypothetical protein